MFSTPSNPLQDPKDNKNTPIASNTFSFPPLLPPPPISIYKAKLSIKLDEENFLIWRLLVAHVIKGHMLHKFLTNSVISPNAGSVNSDWDETDQILFSWMLSTLSEPMLRRVIGCKTSK